MKKQNEKYLRIKLFATDVDGVLTDAGMYYSESGDELKKFSTHDGGGIILLKNVGIKTCILTTEKTAIVERRSQKMNVDYLIQGAKNKLKKFNEFLKQIELSPEEVAYIGDDINDIPILKIVGISATVPDNCLPKDFPHDYITKKSGGGGAIRDFAEWLLVQREQYEFALSLYLKNITG